MGARCRQRKRSEEYQEIAGACAAPHARDRRNDKVPAAARTLAEFALALAYDDIPAPVVERAKACMTDTVGAAAFGAALPWSRIVLDYARRNGAPGDSTVIATDVRLRAPFAAMVN